MTSYFLFLSLSLSLFEQSNGHNGVTRRRRKEEERQNTREEKDDTRRMMMTLKEEKSESESEVESRITMKRKLDSRGF